MSYNKHPPGVISAVLNSIEQFNGKEGEIEASLLYRAYHPGCDF